MLQYQPEFVTKDNRKLATPEEEQPVTIEQEPKPKAKPEMVPPTFLEQIISEDFIAPWVLAGLLPGQYIIDSNMGLITRNPAFHAFVDVPWIFVNNDGTRECDFYKHVDAIYNFIPPPCRGCWKVVVVPKTLKQLFQLSQIEIKMAEADPYCFCKCGIEERDDVERNYGGYFYCNSLEEGLLRLEQVKAAVYPVLGEDVRIYLKRGCTEYERKYGRSDKWDDLVTPAQEAIWRKLGTIFKLTKIHTRQPEIIKKHVMVRWIMYAASIGDPTVKELNGGRTLYPGYVEYGYPQKPKEPEKEEK